MTGAATLHRRALIAGGVISGFEAVGAASNPLWTARVAVARERLVATVEHADNSAERRVAILARLGHPVAVSEVWRAKTREVVDRLTDSEVLSLACVLDTEASLGRAFDSLGLA